MCACPSLILDNSVAHFSRHSSSFVVVAAAVRVGAVMRVLAITVISRVARCAIYGISFGRFCASGGPFSALASGDGRGKREETTADVEKHRARSLLSRTLFVSSPFVRFSRAACYGLRALQKYGCVRVAFYTYVIISSLMLAGLSSLFNFPPRIFFFFFY